MDLKKDKVMNEVAFAILKPAASKAIGKLWENRDSLLLFLKTNLWKYRKQDIRFSISYIFRIRIPNTDSYLLVLNRRIANQLQPVGGSYKRYGDDSLFEKWGYKPDNKKNGLGTDGISDKDLRFKVKGKNVINVIKWFEEGREREVSGNREFIEELIEPGIIDKNIFCKISYRHLKRVSRNLQWSEHHQCYEVLIYDVLELVPTTEQEKYLTELYSKGSDLAKGYAFADLDHIAQLRFMEKGIQVAKIGGHTKFTINEN